MDKALISKNRRAYFRDIRAILIVITVVIAVGIAGTIIGNRGELLLLVLILGGLMVYAYYYKKIIPMITSLFELSKCVQGEMVTVASVGEDDIQGQYMKGEGQLGYHKYIINGEDGGQYRLALCHTEAPKTPLEEIICPGEVYELWYLPRSRVTVGLRPYIEGEATRAQLYDYKKLKEELGGLVLPLG